MTSEQGPFGWLVKQGMSWLSKGRLAKTSGQLRLPGLRSDVEVIRDRWGVPHIYAENETDLLRAQGFVHAQDRFFQMEFQRRLVAGRMAEVFGQPVVSYDRWMRVLGMYRIAEQEVEQLGERERQALEAYTAGINAWLKFRHLPVEFSLLRFEPELWTLADSLAWSKMMAWTLATNWECELLRQQVIDRLGEEQVDQLELRGEENWPVVLALPDALNLQKNLARLARSWVGPGVGDGVGSNNWVVSGARTDTGKPILANDMHLLLSTPAIWYENHLVGGELNVTGVSLPGLPMVISGHNGQVAWGLTAGMADVQDLFEEHLRRTPDGKVEYEFRGEWLPAEVRREEIGVRFSAAVVEEVVVTRHGPVITPLVSEEVQKPLALCCSAAETSGGTFRAIFEMNRARDCNEFHAALRTWNAPVLNMGYADTQGNIAYTLAGRIPIRAQGDGKTPVPGWSGEYEWTGFIPFDHLPHLFNPPAGYIVTANNRVAGPDYPYFLGRDYYNSDRAERIIELLHQRPRADMAYMQRMHSDQVSPSAQTVAQVLSQLKIEDPRLAQVVQRLSAWDGTLAADSGEAAVYQVFMRQLLQVIFEEKLGDLMPRFSGDILNAVAGMNQWSHHTWAWLRRELLRPHSPWFDLGSGETREAVLRQALERTVNFLTQEQGPEIENWAWGSFHKLTFQHLLGRVKPLDQVFNVGPFPAGGDANTIWAGATLLDRIDSSDGMVGPPFRLIADLADLRRSVAVLAPGQSGQVGSPHYADQVDAWFNGEYHPVLYQREDVLREQEACLDLLR